VLLTTLDLSSNELCGIDWRGQGTYNPSGIMAIAKALEVNAVLKSLNLSENKINDTGATAIATALEVNAVLTELNLRFNEISPEGATAIAKALEVNAVLTNLDLSSNQLCGVWLNVNMYGGQQGTYDALGITAIAEALKVNRVLTRLNLQLTDLDNTAKDALRAAKSAPLELVL